MVSSILQKNEQKSLTLLLSYLRLNCFRSFFGKRIEETKNCFQDLLTFSMIYIYGPVQRCNFRKKWNFNIYNWMFTATFLPTLFLISPTIPNIRLCSTKTQWPEQLILVSFQITPLLRPPQGPQGCLEKWNCPLSLNLAVWCAKIGLKS